MTPESIDWAALRSAAREAAKHAYAPYSKFRVGAAALTKDGDIVTGCNVENASYGVTLCAECGLVSSFVAAGGKPKGLAALACVTTRHRRPLMPCGRCRQVLYEFGGDALLIDHRDGPKPLGELLLDAFGPDDL